MGISAAAARQLCKQAGAPLPAGMVEGKFEKVANTRRKIFAGISFRSTLEADCYRLLLTWQAAGVIRGLTCQPVYVLQPKMRREGKALRQITYIADFRFDQYNGAAWRKVVVDAKGFRMPVYRIKAKIFQALYPNVIFEEWTRETLKRNGG